MAGTPIIDAQRRAAVLAQLREQFKNNPGILRKMVEGFTALPRETYQTGNFDIPPSVALPYALQMVSPQALAPVEGALGIFGGRIGAKRTGRELTSVGKDEKPRFEIDDSQSKLNMAYDDLRPRPRDGTANIAGVDVPWSRMEHPLPRLGEVFEHPELYAAYPDLKNIRLMQSPNGGGSYHHQEGGGVVSLPGITEEGNRSVLLHELQHAVQAREGFDLGSNPIVYQPAPSIARAEESARLIQERLNALYAKVGARDARDTPYGDEIKALLAARSKLGALRTNLSRSGSPNAQYRRNAGETEARNVQYRDNVRRSLGEKYLDPRPERTEDVPRSKQTLGDLLIKAMGNRS